MNDKRYRHRKLLRRDFLTGVKGRLENDVTPYLRCIREAHLRRGMRIGFWALARMLFPVIEAVANTIYEKGHSKGAARLLQELGVPFPNVAWEMYRHSLMHNDEPAYLVYRQKRVVWKVVIGIGGGRHGYSKIDARNWCLEIHLGKLFQDFIAFLDQEISKSGNRIVWMKEGVSFNRHLRPKLKAELHKLFGSV